MQNQQNVYYTLLRLPRLYSRQRSVTVDEHKNKIIRLRFKIVTIELISGSNSSAEGLQRGLILCSIIYLQKRNNITHCLLELVLFFVLVSLKQRDILERFSYYILKRLYALTVVIFVKNCSNRIVFVFISVSYFTQGLIALVFFSLSNENHIDYSYRRKKPFVT